jgi:hypothetical protein
MPGRSAHELGKGRLHGSERLPQVVLGESYSCDLDENGGEIGGDHGGEKRRLRSLPEECERGETETRAAEEPR